MPIRYLRFLGFALLLVLPVSLAGQVLNNTGGMLHISDGAELYTPDSVKNTASNASATIDIVDGGQLTLDGDDRQLTNNATLSNDGVIRLDRADLINRAGATYNGSGGTVRFATGDPTTDEALLEMNGEAIDTLVLQGPAVRQDADGNDLFVTGGLRLSKGALVVDPTLSTGNRLVYQGSQAELQFNGFASVNDFSYVVGSMEQSGTGELMYPLGLAQVAGSRRDWSPIRFAGVQGTSPQIAVQAQPSTPSLTAGRGVGTVNTSRSWDASLVSGSFTGADSVTIPLSTLDNLVPASPSTGELQTYVVAQSVSASRFVSLGGNFATFMSDSATTSDSLLNAGLGRFVLARCQYLPPDTLLADQDSICLGDSSFVEAFNLDPEADQHQWQVSLNGAAGPYSNIGAALNVSGADTTLDLLDTLSQSSTFQLVTSGTGPNACDQVLSSSFDDTARTDVQPGLKLDISAFLQGPYDDATGDMSIASLGGFFSTRYGPGGTAGDTVMSTGTSVPANAVDVVALELWDDTNSDGAPDAIADSTFGWLLANGSIVRFKDGGTGPVVDPNFCNASGGQRFVVLRHRNHLPVVTSAEQNFSSGSVTLDLRGNNAAVGSEMVEIDAAPLTFGLPAGNVNDTPPFDVNEVNAFDFFLVRQQNGLLNNGIFIQDVNLDGDVNSLDINLTQTNNNQLLRTSAPVN